MDIFLNREFLRQPLLRKRFMEPRPVETLLQHNPVKQPARLG